MVCVLPICSSHDVGWKVQNSSAGWLFYESFFTQDEFEHYSYVDLTNPNFPFPESLITSGFTEVTHSTSGTEETESLLGMDEANCPGLYPWVDPDDLFWIECRVENASFADPFYRTHMTLCPSSPIIGLLCRERDIGWTPIP